MRERGRCLQCLLQILQALTPGWPLPLMMGKDTQCTYILLQSRKTHTRPMFLPIAMCAVCVCVSVILYKVSFYTSSVPKTITVVAAISEALEHWSPQSIFQINRGRTAFSRSREPKMFIRIKIQTLREWTKNQKNWHTNDMHTTNSIPQVFVTLSTFYPKFIKDNTTTTVSFTTSSVLARLVSGSVLRWPKRHPSVQSILRVTGCAKMQTSFVVALAP